MLATYLYCIGGLAYIGMFLWMVISTIDGIFFGNKNHRWNLYYVAIKATVKTIEKIFKVKY